MHINLDRNFSLAFLINDTSFKYNLDIKNRLLLLPLRFPYSHILDYNDFFLPATTVILKGFEYCEVIFLFNDVYVSKSNKVCKLYQIPFKSTVEKYLLINVNFYYDQITSYILAFKFIIPNSELKKIFLRTEMRARKKSS